MAHANHVFRLGRAPRDVAASRETAREREKGGRGAGRRGCGTRAIEPKPPSADDARPAPAPRPSPSHLFQRLKLFHDHLRRLVVLHVAHVQRLVRRRAPRAAALGAAAASGGGVAVRHKRGIERACARVWG